jgi:hypothetical protein
MSEALMTRYERRRWERRFSTAAIVIGLLALCLALSRCASGRQATEQLPDVASSTVQAQNAVGDGLKLLDDQYRLAVARYNASPAPQARQTLLDWKAAQVTAWARFSDWKAGTPLDATAVLKTVVAVLPAALDVLVSTGVITQATAEGIRQIVIAAGGFL